MSGARFHVFLVVVCSMIACGKKGPPLPPLVHLPAAPPDLTAERRGDDVKLRFTVPSSNTDGTRPANIERIDVYAFTGTFTADNDQVLKYGTKVASVPVKAPKNPALTTEPEEPAEEPDLTEEGLDQGARAELDETLTEDAFKPVVLPAKTRKPAADVEPPVLFPEPPHEVLWRYFMAIPINTDGRKGPPSKRMIVPLVPSPAPPSGLEITYDETGALLKWKPSPSWAPIQPKAPDGKPAADAVPPLPSRFFGMDFPTLTYNVYDASPAQAEVAEAAAAPPLGTEVKLATTPIGTTDYYDPRIEWGKTRCYVVRAIETVTGQTLESVAPPPACVTLKDTFPPAAPKDLRLIAAEGVISLIWEANAEADVAGYIVLRGAPDGMLQPLTPMPVTATTYNDKVAPGVRYAYAVQAVDKAGNRSPISTRVEEAAR